MKYFYIGLLILSLLLCACYFTSRQMRRSTDAMLKPLEDALEASRLGDYEGARRALAAAERSWARYEPRLNALISHERTDEVSQQLCLLRYADADHFESICSALILRIRHLRQMDLPQWHNIF